MADSVILVVETVICISSKRIKDGTFMLRPIDILTTINSL